MNDVAIRRAVVSDIPYLYEICLKTGDAGNDASALFYDPYLIGQYYAAPYLLYPNGVCFVAEHEYRPQGYIIAVPDTLTFNHWLEEVWLPPLRERYPQPFPSEMIRSEDEGRILAFIHNSRDMSEKPWYKDYPAHLHIDLLPSLQGKGMGRALMNTLCEDLARMGIPGVHLGVGVKNENAVAFYRKIGFSTLQEETWGFVMGKRTTV